jgi:hypothetical protein
METMGRQRHRNALRQSLAVQRVELGVTRVGMPFRCRGATPSLGAQGGQLYFGDLKTYPSQR